MRTRTERKLMTHSRSRWKVSWPLKKSYKEIKILEEHVHESLIERVVI